MFANTPSVPDDVLRIPTLTQQPPVQIFDLWAANLHDAAEESEPLITAEMRKMFGKKLTGLQYRLYSTCNFMNYLGNKREKLQTS